MVSGLWIFDRTGSQLALDFANTISGRTDPQPIERLPAYADLVEFARQTALAGEEEVRALLAKARRYPAEAERIHRGAIQLREALYGIYSSLARDRSPAAEHIDAFNRHVACMQLDRNLEWFYEADARGLEKPLGPIMRAALELLEPEARSRVGICGRDTCGFVFYDTTKSHTRRWGEMKSCGNREKARRFRTGEAAG